MNRARPITSIVRRGVRRTCASRLGKRFLAPFFDAEASASQHWRDMIADAGVELEQVVRVRDDGRGILLVRHPERGRCVLKTQFSTRRPAHSLAGLTLARLVGQAPEPLFPRVLAATPDYLLEEYVDGQRFRAWMTGPSFDPQPVQAYFQALKAWSTSGGPWRAGEPMRPYEIQELCRAYVDKCLGHARYFSTPAQLRHLFRFSSAGRRIGRQIEDVLQAAETVQMPRGMMCGDMGNINLLVQRQTHRLYNIDYEFMGPGHHGFDCAYFLSSLDKMGDPASRVNAIREVVFAEGYLGDEACRAFFTAYADLLSTISRTIYDKQEGDRPGRQRGRPAHGT